MTAPRAGVDEDDFGDAPVVVDARGGRDAGDDGGVVGRPVDGVDVDVRGGEEAGLMSRRGRRSRGDRTCSRGRRGSGRSCLSCGRVSAGVSVSVRMKAMDLPSRDHWKERMPPGR